MDHNAARLGSAPTVERFPFIDALRGLAAVWVAGYHFYGGLSRQFTIRCFPEPFHTLLRHGNCGVEIFFVLSGFVIAYSIRKARITPRYFGNFVLRRSIRLEPPYWATIGLATLAIVLSNALRNDRALPWPTWAQIFTHLVYLQTLLGVPNIVEVFWTLCMEVQFYLVFLVLCGLLQRGTHRIGTSPSQRALGPALLVALLVWSIATQAGLVQPVHNGLMIKFWYLFQLGALAWWATSGRVPLTYFLSLTAILVCMLGFHFTVESAVGVLTGVLLCALGRASRLSIWLNLAPLQFLGRISYSLYLVHPVVGVPFAYYFARRWAGPEPSPLAALSLFLLAFAVSILAAYFLYRFVERPSMSVARRFKTAATPDAPATIAAGLTSAAA